MDNQRVFDLLTECRHGSFRTFTLTDKDHDLCQLLMDECRKSMGPSGFQTVVKVCSHQNSDLITDLVEDWVFKGNEAADQCAISGRAFFPDDTLVLWDSLVKHYSKMTSIRDELHRHFVRVGEFAVECKARLLRHDRQRWEADDGERASGEDDPPIATLDSTTIQPSFSSIDFSAECLFPEKLGPFVNQVFYWLRDCVTSPEGILQWVAPHQLLLDFQLQTGLHGCYRRVRDRTWHLFTESDLEANFDFVTASRSFAAYVKAVAKFAGGEVSIARHRPAGVSFHCWQRCVYLSFDPKRIVEIDRALDHISPIHNVKVFKEFRGVGTRP